MRGLLACGLELSNRYCRADSAPLPSWVVDNQESPPAFCALMGRRQLAGDFYYHRRPWVDFSKSSACRWSNADKLGGSLASTANCILVSGDFRGDCLVARL